MLSEQQKHQLKHRELFLSRQFESLPATHIRYVFTGTTDRHLPCTVRTELLSVSLSHYCLLRGKCNVTLLNETDVLAGYLEKEVIRHLLVISILLTAPIYSQILLSRNTERKSVK